MCPSISKQKKIHLRDLQLTLLWKQRGKIKIFLLKLFFCKINILPELFDLSFFLLFFERFWLWWEETLISLVKLCMSCLLDNWGCSPPTSYRCLDFTFKSSWVSCFMERLALTFSIVMTDDFFEPGFFWTNFVGRQEINESKNQEPRGHNLFEFTSIVETVAMVNATQANLIFVLLLFVVALHFSSSVALQVHSAYQFD